MGPSQISESVLYFLSEEPLLRGLANLIYLLRRAQKWPRQRGVVGQGWAKLQPRKAVISRNRPLPNELTQRIFTAGTNANGRSGPIGLFPGPECPFDDMGVPLVMSLGLISWLLTCQVGLTSGLRLEMVHDTASRRHVKIFSCMKTPRNNCYKVA